MSKKRHQRCFRSYAVDCPIYAFLSPTRVKSNLRLSAQQLLPKVAPSTRISIVRTTGGVAATLRRHRRLEVRNARNQANL